MRTITQDDRNAAARGLHMVAMPIPELLGLIRTTNTTLFAGQVIVEAAQQMIAVKRANGAREHKTMTKQQQHTKLLSENTSTMQQLRDEAAFIRMNRKQINHVARVARRIDSSVSIFMSCAHLHVYISMRDLDGFRARRVVHVLETLESKLGVSFDRTDDYAELNCRQYSGKGTAGTMPLCIRVTAYLRNTPKDCERVQTGVKYEERPVYEFRCH